MNILSASANRSRFAAAILGAALLIIPASAFAADAPSKQITGVFDQVRDIVTANKDKVSEEATDEQLKKIIVPLFDFDEMSQRSLGAYWSKANPDEQKEFVDLFSDLLARTYLKRIKRNAEASKITSVTDEVNGEKAMVRSAVVTEGEEISLDYRMLQQDGKWKIYDVIIENVGLVSNYRNEFPGIIRKEGMTGLLTRLRNKQISQVGIPTGNAK